MNFEAPSKGEKEKPKKKNKLAAAIVGAAGLIAAATGYEVVTSDSPDDAAKKEMAAEPIHPHESVKQGTASHQPRARYHAEQQAVSPPTEQAQPKNEEVKPLSPEERLAKFKESLKSEKTLAERISLLEAELKPLLNKGLAKFSSANIKEISELIRAAKESIDPTDPTSMKSMIGMAKMDLDVKKMSGDSIEQLFKNAQNPEEKIALIESELNPLLSNFEGEEEMVDFHPEGNSFGYIYRTELLKIARTQLPESAFVGIFNDSLKALGVNDSLSTERMFHGLSRTRRTVEHLYQLSTEFDEASGSNPLIVALTSLPTDDRNLLSNKLTAVLNDNYESAYTSLQREGEGIKSESDIPYFNEHLKNINSLLNNYAGVNGNTAAMPLRQKVTDLVRNIKSRYPTVDWQE